MRILGIDMSRIVALLLLVQVGGLVHTLVDALDPDVYETCTDDDDGTSQCPPQCDTCSCAHAARTAVPTAEPVVLHVTELTVATPADVANAPSAGASRRIFQPPRA